MKAKRIKPLENDDLIEMLFDRVETIDADIRELRYQKPRFTLIKVDPKTMITLSCIACIVIESLILYKVW